MAAVYSFLRRGRIVRTKPFQQAQTAHRKTLPEKMMPTLPQNELGAAASDIQNQELSPGQLRVSSDAAEHPVRFLITGDDFQSQARSLLDGPAQLLRVQRVTRRAGPDN